MGICDMIKLSKLLALGLFLWAAGASAQQPLAYPLQAKESAEKWLTMVDQGQYKQSWKDAAQIFQSSVSEQNWEKAVSAVRSPLGNVLAREMISSKALSSVPGGPDGSYVVFQYRTSFQNKKNAIETVTPMLDKDGQWHVSGYYVK